MSMPALEIRRAKAKGMTGAMKLKVPLRVHLASGTNWMEAA